MTVLGWLELPEEDSPPEQYWHSSALVENWFRAVRQRQKDRSKGMESIEMEERDDDYVSQDEEVRALLEG